MSIIIAIIFIFGFLVLMSIFAKGPVDSSQDTSNKNLSPETQLYLREKKYVTSISVAGIHYHRYEEAKDARLLRASSTFTLRREPNNKKDPNAVAVYVEKFKIGYIPAYQAGKIADEMDRSNEFEVEFSGHFPRREYDKVELSLINTTIRRQMGDQP